MERTKRRKAAHGALAMLALCAGHMGCADDVPADVPEVEETQQALPLDAFAIYAREPPYLDGQDVDEVWQTAPEWRAGRTLRGDASLAFDQQPVWKAAWDERALYVMVRVIDGPVVDDSPQHWHDDSIEIYLDGNRSRGASYDADDYQLVIAWSNPRVVEAHGKSVPNVQVGLGGHPGFVIYEVVIPWASIGATPAIANRAIGFDVHVNDDDDGGERDRKQSTYALVDSAWTDPRTFGTLGLSDQRLRICPDNQEGHYQVHRAPIAPSLDGAEDANGAYGWAWQFGAYTFLGGAYPGPYPDLAPTFRLTWDAQYLYLLAEVLDDVLVNDSADPWQDDSVELYLDGDNAKRPSYDANDLQLVFRYGDAKVHEPHGRATSGITFASRRLRGPSGYAIEARIPWSVLGPEAPRDGRRIGLDFHVNDDDDGEERDHKVGYVAQQDRAWADPSAFGTGRITECTRD